MELSTYSFEDCLLAALKSEVDSAAIYNKLAEQVENMFLKDRLRFLAAEEEKHQAIFRTWYRDEHDDQEPQIPETSPVPLPEIRITTSRTMLGDVIRQAMTAENAANTFYRTMARQFPLDDERRQALLHIASMEMTHYLMLEQELDNLNYIQDQTVEWPMMHVGP